MKRFLAAAAIAMAGLPALASNDDIVKVKSFSDVATTMDRLEAAVTGAGANVFARVDHAAGAASVDMELAPTQVLIFGNPKIGTRAMRDDPVAGLFLPMKVLVYRDGAGQVLFRGRDISGLGPAARARRGIVRTFERAELFPDLDVAEHVRLAVQARRRRGSRMLGLASADRAVLARTAAILDAAGLGAHAETAVTALSRAVRRRLEVAMMMAMEPALCLFEAPMAGLARDDAAGILGLIAAMNRRDGRTILLVEHDMDPITDIADRILVMEAGWLVADGPPEAVQAAPPDMDPAAGLAAAHG